MTLARERGAKGVREMFSGIAGRYDLANTVLSFGIHRMWRRTLVNLLKPSSDSRVLDLCTGTADLVPILGNRFGGPTIGLDFSLPMLKLGKQKMEKRTWPLRTDWKLLQGDALELPFANESFDLVSVAFGVRNYVDLSGGLKEIRRVLKADGALLVLEFGQPNGLIWGTLYKIYSRFFMPLIGQILTGDRSAYTYLPETAQRFPCGLGFAELLREEGFSVCDVRPLTGGIAWAYSARK